jgi:hypothetical protein
MEAVDHIDFQLGVVGITFGKVPDVLFQEFQIGFRPVLRSQSGNFRLKKASHFNNLTDEVGVKFKVIIEIQGIDGIFGSDFGDDHTTSFPHGNQTAGT